MDDTRTRRRCSLMVSADEHRIPRASIWRVPPAHGANPDRFGSPLNNPLTFEHCGKRNLESQFNRRVAGASTGSV
jgi:hypothetical protein